MENNFIVNENEEPVIATPVVEEAPMEAPAPVEEPVAEMNRGPHGNMTETAPETSEEPAVLSTASFAKSESEPQTVGLVGDGAIGVAAAKPAPRKVTAKKAEPKKEKVAIHSTKNVTWSGVGKVYTGYNIVDADEAEKWLTRNHIRRATPEEVAKEFGK